MTFFPFVPTFSAYPTGSGCLICPPGEEGWGWRVCWEVVIQCSPTPQPHPLLGGLRGSGTKGKRQHALLKGPDRALKIPSAAPSPGSSLLHDNVKGEYGCPAANIWPPRWMFPRKQGEWNGGQSRGRRWRRVPEEPQPVSEDPPRMR